MQSETSSEGAPTKAGFTDAERAGLLSSLTAWLAILDGVLARELSPERREELASGAAELRGIVDEMINPRGPSGQV